MNDLTTKLSNGLILKDPFMIASSHWTANDKAFHQLASVAPSAVTLKTTSDIKGGDGKEALGSRRDKRILYNHANVPFATYTDGPSTLELWDLPTTYRMTVEAKQTLRSSIIGLSVLQGESYNRIRDRLDMKEYGYVELNGKYTFRSQGGQITQDDIRRISEDTQRFLNVFSDWPCIVKLPREAAKFLELPAFDQFLSVVKGFSASLIVANSQRLRVPPSRVSGNSPQGLNSGVIVGEHLFLETYNLIYALRGKQGEILPVDGQSLDIIASGGIMDIGAVVDVTAVGSSAVQLCTALDVRGVSIVELLREQLNLLCQNYGSLQNFAEALKDDQSWKQAALLCKEFNKDDKTLIEKALKSDNVVPMIEEALRTECQSAVSNVTPPNDVVMDDVDVQGCKFVVTLSNVSAFVLAHRCVDTLAMNALPLSNTSEFSKRLTQQDFEYDFAILPRSVLTYINKQKSELIGNRKPIEVGVVAQSIMELAGNSQVPLAEIKRVLHFSGVTAREAMGHLLSEIKPIVTELSNPSLLPLFRFWRSEDAVLAKPPLSKIYPHLGTEDLVNRWGTSWQISEDLVLVASQAFIQSEGGATAVQYILANLDAEREKILEDTDQAANECWKGGFRGYFEQLLTGDTARLDPIHS